MRTQFETRPRLGTLMGWLSALLVATAHADEGARSGDDRARAAAEAAPATAGGSSLSGASADALVATAIQRRRQGDDAGALEALERARALDPRSARVQVHLASVHQALGHWVAADALLSEVLEQRGDGYVERNRALLEDALQVVAGQLGELAVSGSPPGAEVRLDGRVIGTLPLERALKLPPGAHVLELHAPGYWPIVARLQLHAREKRTESMQLHRRAAARPLVLARPPADADERDGILTWSLAGAAAAAGVAGAIGWGLRESHARTWNGEGCLPFGSTREGVCGQERDAVRHYEALAITGGAAAVALGGAAWLSAWLNGTSSDGVEGAALGSCTLGTTGLVCHARF